MDKPADISRCFVEKIKRQAARRGQGRRTEYISTQGYRYIYKPEAKGANKRGYVLEHRHVMALALGRDLRKNETVHHINGQRTDNRPENLELWVTSQPSGQRPCDLVGWAIDIMATYADEVDAQNGQRQARMVLVR